MVDTNTDALGGNEPEAAPGPQDPAAAVPEGEIGEDLAADLATAALSLARRFAAGATLWCLAPAWEPHAQHIAVEFVHPVLVGAKALPAVALTGPAMVGAARLSVRPGDVIIAVAAADDPQAGAVIRRAPAWGASTLWIGNGPRPPAGAADHVLWLDDPDPGRPAAGGFVLLYHLLWELTHVCFEHPGLLAPDAAADCDDEVCVTCSDEGRLGEVVTVGPGGEAVVLVAGYEERVSTALVEPVRGGDLVLVHAGMAISRLAEEGRP